MNNHRFLIIMSICSLYLQQMIRKLDDRFLIRNLHNNINLNKMYRKIAIPVENGVLSGHFGHAKEFALVEVKDGKVVKNEILIPPPHEPGVLPKWLGDLKATDILSGGMGQKAIQLFLQNNINVFVGVAQKTVLELVDDLITNSLESGANYCNH